MNIQVLLGIMFIWFGESVNASFLETLFNRFTYNKKQSSPVLSTMNKLNLLIGNNIDTESRSCFSIIMLKLDELEKWASKIKGLIAKNIVIRHTNSGHWEFFNKFLADIVSLKVSMFTASLSADLAKSSDKRIVILGNVFLSLIVQQVFWKFFCPDEYYEQQAALSTLQVVKKPKVPRNRSKISEINDDAIAVLLLPKSKAQQDLVNNAAIKGKTQAELKSFIESLLTKFKNEFGDVSLNSDFKSFCEELSNKIDSEMHDKSYSYGFLNLINLSRFNDIGISLRNFTLRNIQDFDFEILKSVINAYLAKSFEINRTIKTNAAGERFVENIALLPEVGSQAFYSFLREHLAKAFKEKHQAPQLVRVAKDTVDITTPLPMKVAESEAAKNLGLFSGRDLLPMLSKVAPLNKFEIFLVACGLTVFNSDLKTKDSLSLRVLLEEVQQCRDFWMERMLFEKKQVIKRNTTLLSFAERELGIIASLKRKIFFEYLVTKSFEHEAQNFKNAVVRLKARKCLLKARDLYEKKVDVSIKPKDSSDPYLLVRVDNGLHLRLAMNYKKASISKLKNNVEQMLLPIFNKYSSHTLLKGLIVTISSGAKSGDCKIFIDNGGIVSLKLYFEKIFLDELLKDREREEIVGNERFYSSRFRDSIEISCAIACLAPLFYDPCLGDFDLKDSKEYFDSQGRSIDFITLMQSLLGAENASELLPPMKFKSMSHAHDESLALLMRPLTYSDELSEVSDVVVWNEKEEFLVPWLRGVYDAIKRKMPAFKTVQARKVCLKFGQEWLENIEDFAIYSWQDLQANNSRKDIIKNIRSYFEERLRLEKDSAWLDKYHDILSCYDLSVPMGSPVILLAIEKALGLRNIVVSISQTVSNYYHNKLHAQLCPIKNFEEKQRVSKYKEMMDDYVRNFNVINVPLRHQWEMAYLYTTLMYFLDEAVPLLNIYFNKEPSERKNITREFASLDRFLDFELLIELIRELGIYNGSEKKVKLEGKNIAFTLENLSEMKFEQRKEFCIRLSEIAFASRRKQLVTEDSDFVKKLANSYWDEKREKPDAATVYDIYKGNLKSFDSLVTVKIDILYFYYAFKHMLKMLHDTQSYEKIKKLEDYYASMLKQKRFAALEVKQLIDTSQNLDFNDSFILQRLAWKLMCAFCDPYKSESLEINLDQGKKLLDSFFEIDRLAGR